MTQRLLEHLSQELRSAADQLAILAASGLDRIPADVSLTDAIEVLRANEKSARLELSIQWQDGDLSPMVTWSLLAADEYHSCSSLSALLRLYASKTAKPDTLDQLERKLSLATESNTYGEESGGRAAGTNAE